MTTDDRIKQVAVALIAASTGDHHGWLPMARAAYLAALQSLLPVIEELDCVSGHEWEGAIHSVRDMIRAEIKAAQT